MMLGDMNAKVGKEEAYRSIIGKECLHKTSTDNDLRLTDFTGGKGMIIKSTLYQRKGIKKCTWVSPEANRPCNHR